MTDAPREQRPRVSDDEARRFLAAWPEVDGLDDIVADFLDMRAEIVKLRKALATARREGWIAGRDAAANHVDNPTNAYAVRALAPPDAADGGSDG